MAPTLIIDSDTAGDDTQAILMAALAERVDLAGVTVVAGNVAFDDQVENAKYTLQLADAADRVPVYEGARRPLLKEGTHAEHVHGEGGLGGDFAPDTGIASADAHATDAIVETARDATGEVWLACIGPLTNVALALRREPALPDLLDRVVVMGGAVETAGNESPAAEFNFWVDPDAAKIVVEELSVTLVDWGLCVRDATFDSDELDELTGLSTPFADFFDTVTTQARAWTRERFGEDSVTLPDSLAVACLLAPEIVAESTTCAVDVDERAGLTRGYTLVYRQGQTARDASTKPPTKRWCVICWPRATRCTPGEREQLRPVLAPSDTGPACARGTDTSPPQETGV